MQTLWASSIRHLLRHPAQLALALVGLSVGVATIVAVDIATASSRHAFELSMDAVNGAATHQIVGGPNGVDEQVYVKLKTLHIPAVADPPAFAPVVEGYVSVGSRALQLVGLDPLATAGLNARTEAVADAAGEAQTPAEALKVPDADLRQWFTRPGTVVMSARTAADLGLTQGQSFDVDVGGRTLTAVLLATLQDEGGGYDALLLTDIAQAQEWMDAPGRLSRIDVRVADGPDSPRILAAVRASLPPGVELQETQSRSRENLDMTAAFTTNLKAMSLLALLVSTLLIYGAISFAVVQRRRSIGILRALGATPGQVLAIVLSEALVLGVVGAAAGVLLGLAIGRELVHLVSRTINDLYFVVAVNSTTLPTITLVKAVLAGIGTALVAALLPAFEAVSSTPQLGMRRSVLEKRAVDLARKLVIVSASLAVAAGAVVFLSTRSLFAGFTALFMLLLSVAALTPAVLRSLARVAAFALGRGSPVARLAFGDIAASLSRTGVAVAALGMAVAAMIGVSIMVESFRESLHDWLQRTMRADVYLTAPGAGGGRPERRLEADLVPSLLGVKGIAHYSMSRRVVVETSKGPIPLEAAQLSAPSYATYVLTEGDPASTWSSFKRGGVVISEPLAWRLQLKIGDRLTVSTASGPRPFPVAGVYREYGNDRGDMLMDLRTYRELWHDDAVTSMGFYLDPGVPSASVIGELESVSRGRQALLIRSNADIRALSMRIFDRTFVITRVLNWLAAGVAAVGLISSLLAWELERSRELAIVRSLGLTAGGTAVLIETQTAFMGLAAMIAAVPAGLLTALVLTDVINRRAFGWRIDLHLNAAQFTNALVLSLTAALVAGLYPAWRAARAPIAVEIREE
ncbi:MAG TPA: FtsX-like permease family protein [Steroidobacteraceae bacterium]|nr:FtsX-like permease family protein [Steroidobacteraceae bacterium]